jgi:ABC-type glycerol-3-phosphate transport system substrate-binding protein
MRYFKVLPFSPYATDTAMGTVIDKYMQPVMKGQAKLDAAAQQLEAAVNQLLKQGKEQAG